YPFRGHGCTWQRLTRLPAAGKHFRASNQAAKRDHEELSFSSLPRPAVLVCPPRQQPVHGRCDFFREGTGIVSDSSLTKRLTRPRLAAVQAASGLASLQDFAASMPVTGGTHCRPPDPRLASLCAAQRKMTVRAT